MLLAFGGVGLIVCGVFLIINLLTVGWRVTGFFACGSCGVGSTICRFERSILSLDAMVSAALTVGAAFTVEACFVGVVLEK